MARIRSLQQSTSQGKAHPTEVDCAWQVVPGPDGPLLQLSTYGSDSRQSEPKVSQTIQVDERVARQLAALVQQVFG